MMTLSDCTSLRRTAPSMSGSSFGGHVLARMRRAQHGLQQAFRVAQARRALAMLDDRMMQDVGLSIDMDLD